MNWKSKKILITGAGGFIGSHLTEQMVALGADVRAMVHYNSGNRWGNLELVPKETLNSVEIVSGDIRDPFFVRKAVKDCSVVFHLAALIAIPYSYVAPKDFFDTNVGGTLNVMQACLDEGVEKVVHTSTSEVYGTARYVPIDEEHTLQGQSPYSASKIGGDKVAESYYNSFELPVATLRPFNTFGPRQSARAVIPTIISQILSGKKDLLLGSTDTIRDFTFVKDTANAFVKVAESPKAVGTVVNCGVGEGITIAETARMVKEITGSKASILLDKQRVRPKKSEVMRLVCANKKIEQLAGWKPKYSFREGLEKTIDAIRKDLHLYKPEIYNI